MVNNTRVIWMNLIATEFILTGIYLHLKISKKTVMLTKPNHNLTSFNEFVCTHALVYEYNLSSNFQNCILKEFSSHVQFIMGQIFLKTQMICFSFVVHMVYDGNDHFRENYMWVVYFFYND